MVIFKPKLHKWTRSKPMSPPANFKHPCSQNNNRTGVYKKRMVFFGGAFYIEQYKIHYISMLQIQSTDFVDKNVIHILEKRIKSSGSTISRFEHRVIERTIWINELDKAEIQERVL